MDAVEEVKARVDIEQLVGQYVDLKRSGASLKGLCPFHQEKTPSFHVFPARGSFHCFGCGVGGDVFTFLQNYEKLDFREALRRLASRAGVELPEEQERRRQVEEHGRLYGANEAALEFFRDQLKGAGGKLAQNYLYKRKLSAPIQVSFGLGYAPESRHALSEALTARGFTAEEMVDAGLVLVDEHSGELRDRFRGRLMFPIRDGKGRVTGFGGRTLGDGEPKYLNSPQTEIFDKSRCLFAIEHAEETIRQRRRAVVVEGYIDAIRAHEAGSKDVVASLGTAITTHQLQVSGRLAPMVVLALDPDTAGQAAAVRAGLAALAGLPRKQRQLPDSLGRRLVPVGLAIDLRIARIPLGAGDPDELIQRDREEWERIVDASVPAFEFYFDSAAAAVDRSDDGWRQDLIDRVMPVIQEFSFAVGTQAAWVERLAEVTGVQSRLLQNQLMVAPAGAGTRRRAPSIPAAAGTRPSILLNGTGRDPETEAEDSLLWILIREPVPEEVVKALADLHPRRPEVNELLERISLHAGSGRRPSMAGLGTAAAALAERLKAVDGDDLREARVVPAVRLHIARMRLSKLRRKAEDLQVALGEIGPEDRETGRRALADLFEERQVLEQQIDVLQREVVAGV